MRNRLFLLSAVLLAMILSACSDFPTSSPTPDVTSAGPALSGDCVRKSDGKIYCPVQQPIWCDPYHYECGDDDCVTSAGGGGTEGTTVQGCNGGGGDDGGDDGDGDGGGGGSGGPGSPPPPPCPDYGCPPRCDPAIDPDCEQPLTSADSSAIRTALRDYLHPDSAIADSTARRQCGEMRRQFEAALAAGNVFRGGSNSTGDDAHYGMTYDGQIHMDPWLLDSANDGDALALRELANTALHEAAHVMGHDHPNGFTMDAAGHDVYTDPYFNLLSPGPNSCIKY